MSPDPKTIRRVILASSLGFFGGKFFPPGNETAQLLASLATFGVGIAATVALVAGRNSPLPPNGL